MSAVLDVTVVEQAKVQVAPNGTDHGILSLQSGDRLARAEFHRRYAAHPEIRKAELVEGVVYVPSPVGPQHGGPHGILMMWLGVYCAATVGTVFYDNVSVVLDTDNEVQPDGCLLVKMEHGGSVNIGDSFLEGAPELVVEVAASSAAYDLHDKLDAYRRSGVREYVVALTYEHELRWYHLHEGRYIPVQPDAQGIYRSSVFPGLVLDSMKFWHDDGAGVLATLQEGLRTAEHAAFVEHLRRAKP